MELPQLGKRMRSYSMTDLDDNDSTHDFRAIKRANDVNSDFRITITVLVGAESIAFTVHQIVICRRSKFFEARCSRRWQSQTDLSSKETPVMLTDIDAATFARYVHCLYFEHTAPCSVDLGETTCDDDQDFTDICDIDEYPVFIFLDELVHTYVLADRFGDLHTANIIMDKLVQTGDELSENPHPATVKYALDNTTENSPLQNLMKHYYVLDIKKVHAVAMSNDLPGYFLARVIKDLIGMRQGERVVPAENVPRCHWHQHDAQVPECVEDEDKEQNGEK